jgi:hypothetical protein
MKINQISVFLENKKGRLAEVSDVLGKNNVNIRALTIAESEDFGVLRIVVDKPDETMKILKDHGFVASFTDIVAVEVPDAPGGLSGILKILCDEDVNVEYMYGFGEKFSDKALLVFRFEDPDHAVSVLQAHKFRVLRKEEVVNL